MRPWSQPDRQRRPSLESTARNGSPPHGGARLKLGLAGDTMLGRGVAEALETSGPESLFADEVVEVAREADLFVLNLECCISTRGSPWPAPGKPFFFRAPPAAVDALTRLGVDCVTLANNHALDYGNDALLDTLDYLAAAGIRWTGAGPDLERARAPAVLHTHDFRVRVVGVTDHPRDFAATAERPGVAYANLRVEMPSWLLEAVRPRAAAPPPLERAPAASGATGDGSEGDRTTLVGQLETPEIVLISPHWGPNMTQVPPPYVRRAAAELRSRATLVAGHSAHVFHGVEGNILYDMGDLLDDYAVDPKLRNDLGLLFLVTLDGQGPLRLEAVPLKLEFCHTRLATGEEAEWIRRRFRSACAALGTEVGEEGGRLVAEMR